MHLGWNFDPYPGNSCPRSQSRLIRGKHLRSATSVTIGNVLNALRTFEWVHLVHLNNSLFLIQKQRNKHHVHIVSFLSQTSKNKMNILTIFTNNTFKHHWFFRNILGSLTQLGCNGYQASTTTKFQHLWDNTVGFRMILKTSSQSIWRKILLMDKIRLTTWDGFLTLLIMG